MAKSHFSQLTVALTAVVVSSVVAAAGLTIAQTGETCNGQAKPTDWHDCEVISCSSTSGGTSNWQCTQMKSSSSSGGWSSTGWSSSGGWSSTGWSSSWGYCPENTRISQTAWCDMSTGTPTWKESGGGGYTGGGYTGGGMSGCPSPYPMGGPYTCRDGNFVCYEFGKIPDSARAWDYTCTPSGWTKGGTTGDGSTMPATCTACITAGGTMMTCPTCPGSTGGGGGGSDCYARCIAEPSSPAICNTRCYPGSSGGTGGTWGGGGGGTKWCFYGKATRDGVSLGYGLDCREGDAANCYKESHNQANPKMESPSTGIVLGSSSSCYWDSTGYGGGTGVYGMSGGYGTGGYGGTGGGGMDFCLYNNARWNNIAKKVWCEWDYGNCSVVENGQKTAFIESTRSTTRGNNWSRDGSLSLGSPNGGCNVNPDGSARSDGGSSAEGSSSRRTEPPKGCPTSMPHNSDDVCVEVDGRWVWQVPEKKPEPGTLEAKLAALQEKISALDEKIDNLQAQMKQQKKLLKTESKKLRKARTEAQRKEIEEKIDAIEDGIGATRKAGKKAQRELRFLEDEYRRLQFQFPPPMSH